MRTSLLSLILLSATLSLTLGAEKIPTETFFRDFAYDDVTLSPGGRYVAAIVPMFGRKNLAVIDLDKMAAKSVTDYKQHDVEWFAWVGDDRLLFGTAHREVDENGDTAALHGVNRDGSRYKQLVESVRDQVQKLKRSIAGNVKIDVIWPMRSVPGSTEHFLVNRVTYDHVSTREDSAHPDVDRLNVYTGGLTLVARNPGDVESWLSDAKGDIRLAGAIKDGLVSVRWRQATNSEWITLSQFKEFDRKMTPVAFSGDGATIIAEMPSTNGIAAIHEYDPMTKKAGKRLWQNGEVEHDELIWNRDRSRLLGIRSEPDRPKVDWLDEDAKRDQAIVDKSLPTTINDRVSSSRDGNRVVFLARGDRHPGTYYLYERNEKRLSLVAHRAESMKPENLANMEVLKFKARDGLPLVGYLTLPPGSDGKNLPLVLNPHGGPWTRDYWGYNPEVQFLANRGYAVMQVNFRGSTGYGSEFMKAGFKDWGKNMQNDLTDTVKLLVDEGIADPKRVAIFGASYGGYAVMAGLAFTPELYRCGINYVGVNDIVSLLQHDRVNLPSSSYWALKEMVGDLAKDKAKLAEMSPINHVKNIRVPVLMAYGEVDRRVHIAQARSLASELRKYGKKYELIVEPNEGHGFRDLKTQTRFYNRVESFLSENMK